MRLLVYGVFDLVAGAFGTIYTAPSGPVAVRSFADAVRGGETIIGQHPDDFELRALGWFNSETGELEAVRVGESPVWGHVLITARELVRRLSVAPDAAPAEVRQDGVAQLVGDQ